MLKTLTKIFLLIGVLTIMTSLIPDSFDTKIDGAIMYFLSALYALNGIVNVDTIIACIQILIGFYGGVLIFFIFHWVLKRTE